MDDADRFPIVIDLLAPKSCDPEPSTEGEIVVCAVGHGGQAPIPPPSPTLMDKVQEALTLKVGSVVIGPGGPDRAAGFTARIRF